MTVSGPSTVPMGASMFQGIITDEEYKTFTAFQQQLNSDPAIKAINDKIAKLSQELQKLHAEASATREKLIAANPEVKAIQNKIAAAMRTRMAPGPAGPSSMPMPMPATGK